MSDELTVRTHTVAVGDSLRLIALKYYGMGGQEHWKEVYNANKAVIGENPYIIKPGSVLTIPDLTFVPKPPAAAGAEVDA